VIFCNTSCSELTYRNFYLRLRLLRLRLLQLRLRVVGYLWQLVVVLLWLARCVLQLQVLWQMW